MYDVAVYFLCCRGCKRLHKNMLTHSDLSICIYETQRYSLCQQSWDCSAQLAHQVSSLVALATTLIVGNADMQVFPRGRLCQ